MGRNLRSTNFFNHPVIDRYENYNSSKLVSDTCVNDTFIEPHSQPVQILFWTGLYASLNKSTLNGSAPFRHCPFPASQCVVTYDRSKVKESEVILINYRLLPNWKTEPLRGLPSFRSPQQKWVMQTFESPTKFPIPKALWNLFNVTFTYKLDSDIQSGRLPAIGNLTETRNVDRQVSMHQPNGKMKRLVAWVVSNCQTCSQREKYVSMLQKYIEVDVYGKCGDKECPEQSKSFSSQDPCFSMINTTYLFYLAFENSLCEDYMTEKLYRTLQMDVIPVVYGGADYVKLLPPKSFIDIEDFGNPQNLSSYMKYLAEHPMEYMKYFEWKGIYKPFVRLLYDVCAMCEYFHRTCNDAPRSVDLREYWGVDTNCRDPFWLKQDKTKAGLT